MKIIFSLFTILFSASSFAGSSVDQAVLKAGIRADDSFFEKIDKALKLLNEQRYFYPKSTVGTAPSPGGNSYELDSTRTAEQILEQKIGGSCGSSALAFAAILKASGIPSEKIRIVPAVLNRDLAEICPQTGKRRVHPSGNGASGHVFVALQFPDNKWQLINSIDGSVNYERAEWYAPKEVQRLIKTRLAVPLAAYRKLPADIYSSGLTVFQSWSLDEVPIHTFDQRFDLIASGKLGANSAICRFTAP
ncbi:MAG: hypothetical protein EOP06_14745 [Proteobacteria bacterium]|nr:MAG: hypothetical protein EOP06_14745 [Pseudomonadota bacterium]